MENEDYWSDDNYYESPQAQFCPFTNINVKLQLNRAFSRFQRKIQRACSIHFIVQRQHNAFREAINGIV
jgi:hypothetical protein